MPGLDFAARGRPRIELHDEAASERQLRLGLEQNHLLLQEAQLPKGNPCGRGSKTCTKTAPGTKA